ncbi:hypothetical protein B0H13DRAFT_1576964, partial [Mycena leptocephala]
CRICQKHIAGPDRQNHMGKHILLSLRGVKEVNVVEQVAQKYPCGFCGLAISDGACTIGITSGKATSSCPEPYQFQIAATAKSSVTKPCTNVPIRCTLCT